jgi:hypothetical protein
VSPAGPGRAALAFFVRIYIPGFGDFHRWKMDISRKGRNPNGERQKYRFSGMYTFHGEWLWILGERIGRVRSNIALYMSRITRADKRMGIR